MQLALASSLRPSTSSRRSPSTLKINIEKLDTESAISFVFDSPENLSIVSGEVKLGAFQVEQNSIYTVSLEGSEYIGAYGDQVEVNITALRENINGPYFFEEHPVAPVYGGPNILEFTALDTENVYLAIIGAYWWDPRDITVKVTEN